MTNEEILKDLRQHYGQKKNITKIMALYFGGHCRLVNHMKKISSNLICCDISL